MINIQLQDYGIDKNRGFLPAENPLTQLPAEFNAWEKAALNLPKMLISGHVRQHLLTLPQLDISSLTDEYELNRAMLLLSYFGHAYVWGEKEASDTLPANIAVPWYEVAKLLGRPPVLSYASHALYNWKLEQEDQAIELGNIVRLENFYGGLDEDWFVLIHIAIEAQAAPAIQAVVEAQKAVHANDPVTLERNLKIIAGALKKMVSILARMTENCDPHIYYQRVRTFIFGWMHNPALPNGVFYEGVKEWEGIGQKFRGETGAQSSIIPSLDAGLGVAFEKDNPFYQHLLGLRKYMSPKHQAFIAALEKNSEEVNVHKYVTENANKYVGIAEQYNACMEQNHQFRAMHLDFARDYIYKQAEKLSSPTQTGTGGTPFMKYLDQHCQDILAHKIKIDNTVSLAQLSEIA